MNKSILITGVTGTGKSAISKELIKQGYKSYSIEDIKGMFTIINKSTEKEGTTYNKHNLNSVKEHDWICDINKLKSLIRKNQKGIVFYNGTASNIKDMIPLFDKVFLLVANEESLRQRLTTRTSNDFGRTTEVQEWVFSWKQWWEDYIQGLGAIPIDANKDLETAVDSIIQKSGVT